MLDFVTNALQQASSQPLGLLLAMIFGILSAATSACCALPALGVMAGYSGSQESVNRKIAFQKVLFFTLGTIVSLMIIGGVAGFMGQAANASLGLYWKIFAGVVLIIFGLAALKIMPFKIPFKQFDSIKKRIGVSGAVLAGLILGGLVAASSLCCNPIIFGVIGIAVLQKHTFQAVLLLSMFAVGFSIPLGAVLFGFSLGKILFITKNAEKIVRWLAGLILLAVGFYFLLTF